MRFGCVCAELRGKYCSISKYVGVTRADRSSCWNESGRLPSIKYKKYPYTSGGRKYRTRHQYYPIHRARTFQKFDEAISPRWPIVHCRGTLQHCFPHSVDVVQNHRLFPHHIGSEYCAIFRFISCITQNWRVQQWNDAENLNCDPSGLNLEQRQLEGWYHSIRVHCTRTGFHSKYKILAICLLKCHITNTPDVIFPLGVSHATYRTMLLYFKLDHTYRKQKCCRWPGRGNQASLFLFPFCGRHSVLFCNLANHLLALSS